MAEFGQDPLKYLNETHLVESTRFTELHATEQYVTFILKKYSIELKSSNFFLYLHNSTSLQTKQMTYDEKTPLSNPYLVTNINGMENSILYLKGGQIHALPIDGGNY